MRFEQRHAGKYLEEKSQDQGSNISGMYKEVKRGVSAMNKEEK